MKKEIYVMENALMAAAQYAKTSLRYSVYQALYDNALNGTWASIPPGAELIAGRTSYALWYDGADKSPKKEEVMEGLKKSVQKNFNGYKSGGYRFHSYRAAFPLNYDVSLEGTEAGLKASADSPRPAAKTVAKQFIYIEYSGDDGTDYYMEAPPQISENIDTSYLGLFISSKEFVEKGELPAAVGGYVSTLVTSHTKTKPCGAGDITDDEVFTEAMSTAHAEKVEDGIKATITTALASAAAAKTTEKTKWEITAPYLMVSLETWCGALSNTCRPDGTDSLSKTCSFTYHIELSAAVSVTDVSAKYPVYSAEKKRAAMENIALRFAESMKFTHPSAAAP
jgi:hypothetical protein